MSSESEFANCLVLAEKLEEAAERASRPDEHPELERFEGLVGPPEYGEMIASVRSAASELLRSDDWDDARRSRAEGLTALARLVDATAAGEPGVAVELHQTAQAALPGDLQPLLVIALMGRLGFRPDDEPEPRNTPVAEPSPEPEPRPAPLAVAPSAQQAATPDVSAPTDQPDDADQAADTEGRQLTAELLGTGKPALTHPRRGHRRRRPVRRSDPPAHAGDGRPDRIGYHGQGIPGLARKPRLAVVGRDVGDG